MDATLLANRGDDATRGCMVRMGGIRSTAARYARGALQRPSAACNLHAPCRRRLCPHWRRQWSYSIGLGRGVGAMLTAQALNGQLTLTLINNLTRRSALNASDRIFENDPTNGPIACLTSERMSSPCRVKAWACLE